jgi:hypothetical protein
MCAALITRSFRSFPMGWRCRPRGVKSSGDVPTTLKPGLRVSFLHIAALVPPIFQQAHPSRQNRGTMAGESGTKQTAENLPQPPPTVPQLLSRAPPISPTPSTPVAIRHSSQLTTDRAKTDNIVETSCSFSSRLRR